MRISDWSSDVCSSDLDVHGVEHGITSNEIFELESLPCSIVIIGGGYIAIEFAGILNSLGSEVTLLNRTHTILRSYDAELTATLRSEERCVGREWVSPCRSQWLPHL